MGFTRFIQSLDDLVDRKISNIHTSLPAKIVGYSNGRVDVQPYGKYFIGDVSLDYPVLLGCPVTSSGVASPIKVGDDCLVLVTEQSIENWLNNTSGNEVNEKWSLSNCIAICGLQKAESAEQSIANATGAVCVQSLNIENMNVESSIEELEEKTQPTTPNSAGIVKIGENVHVTSDGTISIDLQVVVSNTEPTSSGTLIWIDTSDDVPTHGSLSVFSHGYLGSYTHRSIMEGRVS